MKKIRLATLLLTSSMCAACNFYEEDVSSSVLSEPGSSLIVSESSDTEASAETSETGRIKLIDKFTTTDLEGNRVDESILRGKLTFLNVWATWCGPCQSEIPFLANVHKKYSERDFQVVGILTDILNSKGNIDNQVKGTQENIFQKAKATYTNIVPCKGLKSITDAQEYIPYSVFVDENGYQVGEPLVGAFPSLKECDKTVATMLESCSM